MGIRVRRAGPADMAGVLALRHEVFCMEQGVPVELEYDGHDDEAIHVVAVDGGAVVGTCRLVAGERAWKLGRMAVSRAARGAGVGAAVLEYAHAEVVRQGAGRVVLAAQVTARSFYERHGYTAHGDEFVEAGIVHVAMSREIGPGAPDTGRPAP